MSPSKICARLTAALALVAIPVASMTAAHAAQADPETMTLTAEGGTTARLGKHVTVEFKVGAQVSGNASAFDIWICDDTTVRPREENSTEQNGTCQSLTFWYRSSVANFDPQTSARTMSWLLTTDAVTPGLVSPGGAAYEDAANPGQPITVPTPPEGYCSFAGKFMIVNDWPGGAHSNFLQIDSNCDGTATTTAAPTTTAAALPETGMGTTPSLIGVITLLTGAAVISVRRLRTA